MRLAKLEQLWALPQRDLGPLLRFEVLVPFTLLVWIASGMGFSLPPGPLCDEGMVLFMEGGCDWGLSNIFFFAKASLLLTFNLGLVAAWWRPPASWRGVWPHFALLGVVVWFHWDDTSCDTYYAHPNGNLAQMVFEMACFAALGIALGRAAQGWTWHSKLATLAAWNGLHVGLFYLFLGLAPHWSWAHTGMLSAALLAAAAGARELLAQLRDGE